MMRWFRRLLRSLKDFKLSCKKYFYTKCRAFKHRLWTAFSSVIFAIYDVFMGIYGELYTDFMKVVSTIKGVIKLIKTTYIKLCRIALTCYFSCMNYLISTISKIEIAFLDRYLSCMNYSTNVLSKIKPVVSAWIDIIINYVTQLFKYKYPFSVKSSYKIFKNNYTWYFFKDSFSRKKTLFFLLTKSPWPIFSAASVFIFLFGLGGYLNFFQSAIFCTIIGFLLIVASFLNWLVDLTTELTFLKRYSMLIRHSLRCGFWIFIMTEALLFASFFWAFFHFALEPAIQVATVWPPFESLQMNSIYIPFINTIFLLSSGAALTWLQYSLLAGSTTLVYEAALFLFGYAFLFLAFQFTEYVEAFHQINDGVFGSTLYILTAFHGTHVVIGVLMLAVNLYRFYKGHFTPTGTLGFTLSGWYWHFVDVVWVLVFGWVYVWGTWLPVEAVDSFIVSFMPDELREDSEVQWLYLKWYVRYLSLGH